MVFWIVRAGREGEREQEALDEKIIAIGWSELSDLSKIENKEELKSLYAEKYPEEPKKAMVLRAGQVWRFRNEINKDDLVAMPLKTQSSIAIGEVTGDYEYDEKSANSKHRRAVAWKGILPRSVFPKDILNSLGTLLTVATVKKENAEQRVRDILENKQSTIESDLEDDQEENWNLEEISKDTIIKFLEKKFQRHELARLIDGILIAKGYSTRLSPPGRDGGVDIFASSGQLGFDDPKICIQVKSSKTPVNVDILRGLEGTYKRFGAEYGILVAWGGLNGPATQEIKSSIFTTKLWDQGKIVEELIESYDKLDSKLKAEIPLRKIWAIIEE